MRHGGSGIVAVAVGAAVLTLAGCAGVTPTSLARTNVNGAHSARAQPPTGIVTGTLGIDGGVLEINHHHSLPEAGTVRLIGAHGHIDVTVGTSGQFSVRVPTGRYEVTAGLRPPMDWPMGTCAWLSGPDARYNRYSQLSYIVVTRNEHLRVSVGCLAA